MRRLEFMCVSAVLVVFCICSIPILVAQAPPTIEQALESKGIPKSLASLRNALQDPRPEVRGLAASELATRKDRESIPFIHQALTRASSATERENLAQALISFGDPEGNVAMRAVCEDKKAHEDLRLIAAHQLSEAGDDGCLESVVEILSSTNDHSVRQSAMEFLKRGKVVPPSLMGTLQIGLSRALQDEIPSNRQLASKCILLFKVSSAGSALKDAIVNEKDSATRLQMKSDLSSLESFHP